MDQRAPSIDPQAGSTLIEVMAVMLIIALVASLAVTTVPGTGRAKLKALALETAALLRRERQGAVLTGQSRRISLDRAERILTGEGGEIVAIPPDVVLDVVGTDESWLGRQVVVRFMPDGASTGAALSLSWEGVRYDVNVNWYSGRVAVEAP
jgi:general secretion pathway protein H